MSECVCAPCSHRDSFELFFVHKQGDHPCAVSDGPTKPPQHMRISGLISQTYLLVPLGNGILGRRVAPLSVSTHIQVCHFDGQEVAVMTCVEKIFAIPRSKNS